MAKTKQLIIISLTILFLSNYAVSGIKRETNISTSASFFHDNNIFEDINSKKINDEFLQFWMDSQVRFRKNRCELRINILGNLQQYFSFSKENKYFGRGNIEYATYFDKQKFFSVKGLYFRKNWYSIDKYYDITTLRMNYFQKSYPLNFNISIFAGNYRFSYFSEYDNIHYGICPKWVLKKYNDLSINLLYELKFYNYQNIFITKQRFDNSNLVNLGFEYNKGLIFGCNFQYKYSHSNYAFLINNSFSILPYLSAEFMDFYYQIIVKWNYKSYKNSINTDQISLIFPDPEANTNNQIFFGFDREVWSKFTVTGKIIFFASEYKYQADLYEKFLVGIGLKYSL